MVAKVAVARAVYAIDKPYDYLVPGELEPRLRPGMRVLVPFGSGNRSSDGLVLALREGPGGAEGSSPSPPPWTRSQCWTGRPSSWPSGCGSGISAPSMTQ